MKAMHSSTCASSSFTRLPVAQCTVGRSTQRHRMACRAAEREESAPLFQLDSRHTLSMADVRDAYEVCSLIPDPSDRQQCYSVFGLDGARMASYYDTVNQLEEQLSANFSSHAAAPGSSTATPAARQHPAHHAELPAIYGTATPHPAAAAAVAVAMLWIASQHLVLL